MGVGVNSPTAKNFCSVFQSVCCRRFAAKLLEVQIFIFILIHYAVFRVPLLNAKKQGKNKVFAKRQKKDGFRRLAVWVFAACTETGDN